LKKLLPLVLLLFFLCACGGTVKVKADISEYGDTPITISGLAESDFTVTPNELAELECVGRTAAGKSDKAGSVDAVGPLLSTFMAQYGKTPEDFEQVLFIASDAYEVVLKDEYLTDYDVVLAVSEGEDPLPEGYRPMRLLIPGAESSMWEYAVTRIVFTQKQ
jgi:hypothetical protein